MQSPFRRRVADSELDDELPFQLDRTIEENLARGMTPEEARRQALLELGGVEQVKEACREARGFVFLRDAFADLRYALRLLRKSPGFATIAILTLSLGIGANTAIFSAVDSILLRPLPYKDSSRLVRVWFRSPVYTRNPIGYSPPTAAAIRDDVKAFDASATYAVVPQTWSIDRQPSVLDTVQVSSGFFRLLGVRPRIGRFFSPGEFRPGAVGAAVVSYRIWKERLGADPQVLGGTIISSGKAYAIIGVARKGFHFPAYHFSQFPTKAAIWVPLPEGATTAAANTAVIARMRRGSSLAQLQAQLAAISGPLAQREFGGTYGSNGRWKLRAIPLHEELAGTARPTLLLLFAATGLVLLIAVANVAGLQLVRGRERAREVGIRTALGATRGRVARQWLAESGIVAIAGGAAGLPLAIWGVAVFRALAPSSVPGVAQLRPDWAMAEFGLGISVVAGVLVGLVPAFRLSRLDPATVLHGGEGRAEAGRGRRGVSRGLVIGETALALVLLVCSGLLTRSLDRLIHIRTGMRTVHLLTFDVELIEARYDKPQARIAFFKSAMRKIQSAPGTESVALSSAPLLASVTFLAPVLRSGEAETRRWEHRDISPGYFRTLGIPLLRGRDFNEHDASKSARVAIVNQALARRLWGTASPVGRRLEGEDKKPWSMEVVGVVADARDNMLRSRPRPELFTPMLQVPTESVTFLVRGVGPPGALSRELRSGLWSIDPNLLLSNPRSVGQILAEKRAGPRLETWLTDAFALLGLALGLVGVYGMFSYSVERRRREIGLRMALGAERGDVLRLVLGEGLRVVGWGIAIGLVGALATARLMRGLLYGIRATDPATFAGLAALLAAVSLLACYVPARRAMRVDPKVALRHE